MEEIKKYKDTTILTRAENLKHALSKVLIPGGLYLEFGVHDGTTVNFTATIVNPNKVYGFDSFEGLPEDWERGNNVYKKGHFDLKGELPKVEDNVELIKGFFEDSLKPWLKEHSQVISFLHIDCDLYSGAKYVLKTLNHLIAPGTVIVFDELCDWKDSDIYPAWREGEWKALNEWLKEDKRKVEVLSRGEAFESAIQVTQ